MSATRGAYRNSFDLLRLISASFVIITHSYAILRLPDHDPLYVLSNGQTKFSVFAVDCFFAISGYLVTISLYNSPGVLPYLAKRVLRIVPGFWVAVLLSVVLLAYLTSEAPLATILSGDSIRYLVNTLAFRIHYTISGILSGKTINGSLWTIPYEAFMYVMIVPLWWLNRTSVRSSIIGGVLLIFLTLHFFARDTFITRSLPVIWLNLAEIFRLGSLYMVGALMATHKGFVFAERSTAVLLALGLLAISFIWPIYYYTVFVCIPFFIIHLGLMHDSLASRLTSNGDYSYGVYLWGFPVQQAIVYLTGLRDPIYLTLVAIPVAYVFGLASWHSVEYPFLRLKHLLQPQAHQTNSR